MFRTGHGWEKYTFASGKALLFLDQIKREKGVW
jgi:hypothetical protein